MKNIFCQECGNKNNIASNFCFSCGNSLKAGTKEVTKASKVVIEESEYEEDVDDVSDAFSNESISDIVEFTAGNSYTRQTTIGSLGTSSIGGPVKAIPRKGAKMSKKAFKENYRKESGGN